MKTLKLMCSALAVVLFVSGCGSGSQPASALYSETHNDGSSHEGELVSAEISSQPMTVADSLAAAWTGRSGFSTENNCILLDGALPSGKSSTPVLFGRGSCTKSMGTKALAFTLDAVAKEEAKQELQKGEESKDVQAPKNSPELQKAAPADRLFHLVLKGSEAKTSKEDQGQKQSVPDLTVGEFVLHTYFEAVPEKGKAEQEQVIEQKGKPEQGQEQGKEEQGQVVEKAQAEQGQEQGLLTEEQGKAQQEPGKEPVQAQELGKQEQGKQEQAQVQSKPEAGKPQLIEKTVLIVTKLCSDEYASACEVLFQKGMFDSIRRLGSEIAGAEQGKGKVSAPEQSQKGEEKAQEQGKVEQAEKQITQAQEKVEQAEKQITQAQEKVEQAEKQITQKQEQLKGEQAPEKQAEVRKQIEHLKGQKEQAQQEVKQAQEKMEQAKKDAQV